MTIRCHVSGDYCYLHLRGEHADLRKLDVAMRLLVEIRASMAARRDEMEHLVGEQAERESLGRRVTLDYYEWEGR